MKFRTSPRNKLQIPDKLPASWKFLASHRGLEHAWRALMARLDTVAEHVDALANGNGITPEEAMEKAIGDLIKSEREEGAGDGSTWRLTPTHRQIIIDWYKAQS